MRVFAFDHRIQLEDMVDDLGVDHGRIGAFKLLCLEAARGVADGRPGYGILCDSRLGRDALERASGSGLWIGRPVEWPKSRPLSLEPEVGSDFGGLAAWPSEHVVKVLCFYHPDDDTQTKALQEDVVSRLFAATRRHRLEFLLEIIPSSVGEVSDDTAAAVIHRFYDIGIRPEWWKLEPMKSAHAWSLTCDVIQARDPNVRGIVVLGLDAPTAALEESFATAAQFDLVKGFAVGRTIFGESAREWLAGQIDDTTAVHMMAQKYRDLCRLWDRARSRSPQT